jgi:hypothetical protein
MWAPGKVHPERIPQVLVVSPIQSPKRQATNIEREGTPEAPKRQEPEVEREGDRQAPTRQESGAEREGDRPAPMWQESGVERDRSKGVGAMVDGQTQTQRLGRSGIWCNGLVITTPTLAGSQLKTSKSGSRFPSRSSGKTEGVGVLKLMYGVGSPGMKRLRRRFFPMGFLCAARACQN